METKQSFYGKFYIGPLSVGQGLTLANALRRTLLSEVIGLAITSVSIEGVTHEYSTLKGVRESVLDILLNLKQIVLKSKQSLKRPQTAYIYFQGPGILRAGDLILPPTIQCVDPEQYIATLSSDGFLKMKLVIRQGKNYLVQTPNSLDGKDNKKEAQSPFFPRSNIGKNLNLKAKTLIPFFKYKVFLTLNNQKKEYSDSNRKLAKKKLNTLVLKKYRSLNNLFENSKSKELFLHLFKRQILSILAVKMSARNGIFLALLKNNTKSVFFSKAGFFLAEQKKKTVEQSLTETKNRTFSKVIQQNYGESGNGSIQLPSDFSQQTVKTSNQSLAFPSGFLTSVEGQSDVVSNFSNPFSSMFFNPKTKTKALFIDAVFMPVTKVNYILEESRQKLLDSFDFVDSLNELSTNIQQEKSESVGALLDSDFPREKKKASSQGASLKDKRKKATNSVRGKNQNVHKSNEPGYEESGSLTGSPFDNSLLQENTNSDSCSSTRQSETEQSISETNQTKNELALYFKKNWLNSKESWVLFSSEFNTSLFDNFNQFPKDIIILEIWTNGSILPRTALKKAAHHLSNLFVKFENAKIMGNTFVETNKTYSETIQQLYERYKKLSIT
jgi:DNA-directed RNA polymerase alpha subunit